MFRKLLGYFLVGLVLLLVFLGSALFSMRFAIHGREVRVPRLEGLTPAEAERVANAQGLVVSIESRYYSASVPKGHIVSQMPLPGSAVRRGWKIQLAESLGPPRAAIPGLAGQSEHAAGINLHRRGLEIGDVVTIHLPGVPPQTVVAQSPSPDVKEAASPQVNLVLSAAENGQRYVMPSFVGKPLAEAATALEKAGFELGNRRKPKPASTTNHKAPPALTGTIVKQYPPAGQKVTAGASIYFDVKK